MLADLAGKDREPVPVPSGERPWTAEAAVLSVLHAGPAAGSWVARRAHLRWKTAFAALKALKTAGRVVLDGAGPSSRFRLAEVAS